MKIGYIRVSTEDQNEDRQDMILKPYNLNLIFREKISGKNMERSELKAMMTLIQRNKEDGERDTVYVTEIARLARSSADLYKIIGIFEKNDTDIVSVTEPAINTTTPQGRLFFGIMASLAEFERELIRSRQRDGIAAAKAAGKKFGRPRKEFVQADFNDCYRLYQQRKITVSDMAKRLKISRATVYRLLFAKRNE